MKITIELKEYIRLSKRDMELEFLEDGGVDNWCGYDKSHYPDGEENIAEACVNLEKGIRSYYEQYN